MKKLAFLLLLAPLAFNQSFAGSEHGHCKHGGKNPPLEKMSEDLNLTPEQKEQVQAIMKEKREKMQAIHNESQKKVAAVLNEEQMLKLEEKREAMRKQLRERRQLRMQKQEQKSE